MSVPTKLYDDISQFDPGEFVTLFILDCSSLGGSISYFTGTTTSGGTAVVFNGQTYSPIDCEATGFETKTDEAAPTPTITVNNTIKSFQSSIYELDDLVGAILTRRRTFAKYLDDGSEADTSQYFSDDIWIIKQKIAQNPVFVRWQLSDGLDAEGKMLPKRQIIRDTCTHTYRYYSGGDFVYTGVTCPYTGSNYFDRSGTGCAAADDDCGRRMSDCKLRYPLKTDELPLWSFPTVAKTRVRQ